MDPIYDELTRGSQNRFNGIRRKVQFFSTFSGGVIEALRESGFRLCAFEKQSESLESPPHGVLRLPRLSSNGNIELQFEQQDRDQCKVLIVPFRQDLPFLAKGRYVAQLGFELSRYCNDPDTLRKAMAVNAKWTVGNLLSGRRLPKLYLDSHPEPKPPGTMTFELRGARLVVAMNVLSNLGKYRLSDFELDIDAIREDMQVYFYGLEKYLTLLIENFRGSSNSELEAVAPTEEVHPVEEPSQVPVHYDLPESLPPGNTVRLDQMPPPQI